MLGEKSEIGDLVTRYGVDRIVVAVSDRRGRLPIDELMHAKLSGVPVEEAATTYERLTGKLMIESIKPSSLIFSDGFRVFALAPPAQARRRHRVLGRRPRSCPPIPMALTALAVWLESGHPSSTGRSASDSTDAPFTLFKFRSMRVDAEGSVPVWAREGDDRVTRVGRFIRTTRLDELPQFWNVLRGDMSFVGPRPERPYFVEQLAREIPFYHERHAVKPGVTGWAQVKYRYGASIEDAIEKLRYDLYYVKHLSLVFDLTIVFDTVKVILFGKGAQ